jgi:catechol 2,3-dioxygenase-like lactoylglutathione lyase family enzyme
MPPPSSRARGQEARLSLDHVVLEVMDPARSVDFYRRILGLRPVRLAEFRRGRAPFPSGRVGARTVIDFFGPRMWRRKSATNPNHLCFALSQRALAALEGRLARGGLAITHRDAHNFGARGWGSSIYFRDPDGVTLEARFYPRGTS